MSQIILKEPETWKIRSPAAESIMYPTCGKKLHAKYCRWYQKDWNERELATKWYSYDDLLLDD